MKAAAEAKAKKEAAEKAEAESKAKVRTSDGWQYEVKWISVI